MDKIQDVINSLSYGMILLLVSYNIIDSFKDFPISYTVSDITIEIIIQL